MSDNDPFEKAALNLDELERIGREAAQPEHLTLHRHNHGGRLATDTLLIADFYDDVNREFYWTARNHWQPLLDRLRAAEANVMRAGQAIADTIKVCESRLKELLARAEQAEAEVERLRRESAELVTAGRILLMCSLPNDVSGTEMVRQAREVIDRVGQPPTGGPVS